MMQEEYDILFFSLSLSVSLYIYTHTTYTIIYIYIYIHIGIYIYFSEHAVDFLTRESLLEYLLQGKHVLTMLAL